jgi:hypothetical protein
MGGFPCLLSQLNRRVRLELFFSLSMLLDGAFLAMAGSLGSSGISGPGPEFYFQVKRCGKRNDFNIIRRAASVQEQSRAKDILCTKQKDVSIKDCLVDSCASLIPNEEPRARARGLESA